MKIFAGLYDSFPAQQTGPDNFKPLCFIKLSKTINKNYHMKDSKLHREARLFAASFTIITFTVVIIATYLIHVNP